MMKKGNAEKVIVALTAAFVLLAAGYFWGVQSSGDSYTITTERRPDGEQSTANPSEQLPPVSPVKTDNSEKIDPSPDSATPSVTDSEQAAPEPDPSPAATPEPEDGEEQSQTTTSELVNINTAGKDELITLPMIGESRSEAIITYRTENGPFKSKADIMNVKGISDGIYDRIKDLITVS